jgi:hypothetical protein
MPEFEVGIQRKKITDDISAEIIVKTPADQLIVSATSDPISDESVRLMFKRFLEYRGK